MQEVASDLSQTMLNGLKPHRDFRPSGKFTASEHCVSVIIVCMLHQLQTKYLYHKLEYWIAAQQLHV